MTTSSIFQALDKYWRDNTKTLLMDGVVRSVRGATAAIFLSGSNQVVEAWYGKGTDLVPGDKVLLVRAERANKWVVVAAYGTEQAGHSSLTPPPSIEQEVADLPSAYAMGYTGGTSFTGVNARKQIASVSLNAAKDGIILTGASVYVYASTMSANLLKLAAHVDGGEIGDTAGYFNTTSENKQTLTCILPWRVGAGRHTVTWDIVPASHVVDVLIRNTWAIEV